eukprot:sb/3470056/
MIGQNKSLNLHVHARSSHSRNFKHNIETSSFHQTFSWTPRNVTSSWFRHYSNFRFRAPLTLNWVRKCGFGLFDFNCGLVWLVFVKIYTMAINGTNRCRKAVVEAVGLLIQQQTMAQREARAASAELSQLASQQALLRSEQMMRNEQTEEKVLGSGTVPAASFYNNTATTPSSASSETSSFHQTFSWTPRNVTSSWFRHYSNFRFRAPLTLKGS